MTSQPEWMDELTSLCDALIEGSMSESQSIISIVSARGSSLRAISTRASSP